MNHKKGKNKKEFSKYSRVEKELLTLFFSGIYITNYELVAIGEKVNIDLPMKRREIVLKNLIATAEERGIIKDVFNLIIELIDSRIKTYKSYGNSFLHSREVISRWLQKASSIKKLIAAQTKANPYE
jgi:hypothetical protein